MPANRFPIFEEVPCVLASLVPDGLTEELLPMGLDISLAVPEFQKSEIGKLLPDAWYGSSEPCRTGYIYIFPWVVLGFLPALLMEGSRNGDSDDSRSSRRKVPVCVYECFYV